MPPEWFHTCDGQCGIENPSILESSCAERRGRGWVGAVSREAASLLSEGTVVGRDDSLKLVPASRESVREHHHCARDVEFRGGRYSLALSAAALLLLLHL